MFSKKQFLCMLTSISLAYATDNNSCSHASDASTTDINVVSKDIDISDMNDSDTVVEIKKVNKVLDKVLTDEMREAIIKRFGDTATKLQILDFVTEKSA